MPKKSCKTLNVIMQRRVHLWRIMKKPFEANYLTNISLHYLNLRFDFYSVVYLKPLQILLLVSILVNCLKHDYFVLLIVLFFYGMDDFFSLKKMGNTIVKKQVG